MPLLADVGGTVAVEELGGLIMCDLKSHTVFWAEAEQGGHWGHSWVLGDGRENHIVATSYLRSDLQLLGTSSPQLHTLPCRQAAQSLPHP